MKKSGDQGITALTFFIEGWSHLHSIILNHQLLNNLALEPPVVLSLKQISEQSILHNSGVLQLFQLACHVYEEKVQRPSSSFWTVMSLFQPWFIIYLGNIVNYSLSDFFKWKFVCNSSHTHTHMHRHAHVPQAGCGWPKKTWIHKYWFSHSSWIYWLTKKKK